MHSEYPPEELELAYEEGVSQVIDFSDPTHYGQHLEIALAFAKTRPGVHTQDAEDLAQEVMLGCWRTGSPQVRAPAAYIFTALRNVIKNQKFRPESPYEDPQTAAFSEVPSLEPGPAELTYGRVVMERIGQLTKLTDSQKDVLSLYLLEGKSPREIAAVRDLSINVVQARLYRIRKALRTAIRVVEREEEGDA